MAAHAADPADNLSRFLSFSKSEWAKLRDSTPLTLSEGELVEIRGLNDRVSLDEVAAIYLPLSRLLSFYVAATQSLHRATATFLGHHEAKVPFIIGVAGSVAVGKSTTSRLLRALLSRSQPHPQVALVTTDGFLQPNRVLEARGLMGRKGFPESYDARALLRFLADVKRGVPEVAAPVYSHQSYDIVPGERLVVSRPDILILEGLNVLQPGRPRAGRGPRLFVSDFFDFSIYVDAEEAHIERWYVERFQTLRATVFTDPDSYFHRYASLGPDEAVATAHRIWRDINGPNLRQNILPTRERAHLILHKDAHHNIERVQLRKL
ncbi:MAG: type I pantothenate kinase [Vicinamibacterales bacterium]